MGWTQRCITVTTRGESTQRATDASFSRMSQKPVILWHRVAESVLLAVFDPSGRFRKFSIPDHNMPQQQNQDSSLVSHTHRPLIPEGYSATKWPARLLNLDYSTETDSINSAITFQTHLVQYVCITMNTWWNRTGLHYSMYNKVQSDQLTSLSKYINS